MFCCCTECWYAREAVEMFDKRRLHRLVELVVVYVCYNTRYVSTLLVSGSRGVALVIE